MAGAKVWGPCVLLSALLVGFVGCGSDDSSSGSAASGIDGVWQAKDFTCEKGSLSESGALVKAFFGALYSVWEIKGSNGTNISKNGKDKNFCLDRTPMTVAKQANGEFKITFQNSKTKQAPNDTVCEDKKEADQTVQYRAQNLGTKLFLTETSAPKEEKEQLCGANGLAKYEFKKIESSDILKANGKTDPSKAVDNRTFNDVFSISPAPGTYTHGVVAVIQPKDPKDKDEVFEIQYPNGEFFVVQGDCIGGVDPNSKCVVINETKDLVFKRALSQENAKNVPQTLSYVVAPESKNITMNGQVYNEVYTECRVVEKNSLPAIEGRTKVTNDSPLGANKVAWLSFVFSNTVNVGQTLTLTDSNDIGLSIKGSGDSAPYSASTFYPGKNSSATGDQCTIKLSEFAPGGKARGEISCTLTQASFDTASPIGTTLNLPATEWQCDKWVDSFL